MTEEAVHMADFLKANPEFLIQNPGLLAFVNLPDQTSGNVTSLHARQVQSLRETVQVLEHRIVEMTHAAMENQAIIQKLQSITRVLLLIKRAEDLPAILLEQIKQHFAVPMVCLKLWSLDKQVGNSDKTLLDKMQSIYCGFAENAPTLAVFQDEKTAPQSVVLIPLRVDAYPETFGCLGFGSCDKNRFAPNLQIDFLNTLAEIACAALSRLLATTP